MLSDLRITHVVPALFGSGGVFGGAERYAFELSRHMSRVTPTRLVAFGEDPCEERMEDLQIRVLRPDWYVRGQRGNPVSLTLWGEIRKADIIHCHQTHILSSSLAAAVCRIVGRRVFASDLGGGGFDISGYISTDSWYHGHLHISEYSRQVAGQAELRNSHVIYGGVDTTKFIPRTAVMRDAGYVLYVGRLLPHKGIDVLIDALPSNCELRIAGREGDPDYMRELIRLSEGKKVLFHRECDDNDLIGLYQQARCVVLPSVYRTRYGVESKVPELLGQSLLEGMACGVAGICTNVASMPELVQDGVNGLVVPPADTGRLRDALRWIMDNPADANRMGNAGREIVLERFTWPTVVQRCLQHYSN